MQTNATYLLNNIGAKFLDRQCTNVASELPYHSVTEAVVVQIQDVLNDLW